jgi:hypothetical protein
MPIQINVGDHIASNRKWQPVPSGYRPMLRWARTKGIEIARSIPSANAYFRSLPKGQSLSELMADSTIWISYSPGTLADALVDLDTKDIAMGKRGFRNKWNALAAIIHEIAHLNGAPGGKDHSAELALVACGLGKASEVGGKDDPSTPYDPGVRG